MSSSLANQFDLPEGAIYNGAIAVCQYLDEDGSMRFGYAHDLTDLPLASTIGLLEVAKLNLYERANDE